MNTFSNQLANNIFQSADTGTEFGNISMNFKALLWQQGPLAISTGVGVTVPTADDTNIFLDNQRILTIKNESVRVQPFVAALVTPNDRLFFQAFAQVDFDTIGNEVLNNLDQALGTMQDQNLLYLDLSGGFWVYRNEESFVRGIAPVTELHYTTTLNDADLINGNIGNLFNRLDILNMTFGLHVELFRNVRITNGIVVPLTGNEEHLFDVEYQLQINVAFGPQFQQYTPLGR